MIEVELKQFVSDKTSWQKMLKNDVAYQDLYEMKYIARKCVSLKQTSFMFE